MKKLFLSIAMFLLFSHASFSQTRYYKGEWTKAGSTYLYKSFVKLDFDSAKVEGEIIWTVISPDSLNANSISYYSSKLNMSGVEVFEGNYDVRTKDLTFSGLNKIDPNSIIGLDVYTLKISSDNKMLYGKTAAGGTNSGFFYAQLQNTTTAKKEFNLLRDKIK